MVFPSVDHGKVLEQRGQAWRSPVWTTGRCWGGGPGMAFSSVDHGKVLGRRPRHCIPQCGPREGAEAEGQTEPGRVSTGGSENGRLGLER